MINFLSADTAAGQEEELILLTALPQNVEGLYTAVNNIRERFPQSIIRTSILDERCVIQLDPVNFRDRVDHYMVHIKPTGKMLVYQIYQVETNNFRSIKKFII